MDFSQITIYDFFVFGIIFIFFIILFLLGILASRSLKIILFSISFLFFLAIPFLNVIIMDNYINKVDLNLSTSKKLVYIDNYFMSGYIQNKGKKVINSCNIGIYINKKYPYQNPEFLINFNKMKLAQNENFHFEKIIKNYNFEDAKKIKIRCF